MVAPGPDVKPFRRAAVAVLILAAAVIAVFWILGMLAIFDPQYNPRARPGPLLLVGQSLAGLCGVLSLCASALYGATYVGTAVSRQLPRAGLLLLLAVLLGALWIFLALVAAAS